MFSAEFIARHAVVVSVEPIQPTIQEIVARLVATRHFPARRFRSASLGNRAEWGQRRRKFIWIGIFGIVLFAFGPRRLRSFCTRNKRQRETQLRRQFFHPRPPYTSRHHRITLSRATLMWRGTANGDYLTPSDAMASADAAISRATLTSAAAAVDIAMAHRLDGLGCLCRELF